MAFCSAGRISFACLWCISALLPSVAATQEFPEFWKTTGDSQNSNNYVSGFSREIEIGKEIVHSFQVSDFLRVETLPGLFLDFQLISTASYPNGDTGWFASTTDETEFSNLSIVYNDQSLLASFSLNGLQYSTHALSSDSKNYEGSLIVLDSRNRNQFFDHGGVVEEQPEATALFRSFNKATSALTSDDVTIEQNYNGTAFSIGDQLDVQIRITNTSNHTVSNESLLVNSVFDHAEYRSSSDVCEFDSTIASSQLSCQIPNIAPRSSTIIEYSVLVTKDSYPFLTSSVAIEGSSVRVPRSTVFVVVTNNVLLDTDSDGISDFNELLAGTDPNQSDPLAVAESNSVIDVLFLYTQKFREDIGDVSPSTKINQIVQTTNGYFAQSDVRITIRPVLSRLVGFTSNNLIFESFNSLRKESGHFEFVPRVRSHTGADIVVLIDGDLDRDTTCGLGSVPGVGLNGELFHEAQNATEVYVAMYNPGFPANDFALGCSDITLAHELGHNLGLRHSRRDINPLGTFPWSVGHGIDGIFATIMANRLNFPGAISVPFFSNPASTSCRGFPCGVSTEESDTGADAVLTLNTTRFQIAAKRAPYKLPITSTEGTTNITLYGNAASSLDPADIKEEFLATESVDIAASLVVPNEHQGYSANSYVVLVIDNVGSFFRDNTGKYQAWNGEFSTLEANNANFILDTSIEYVALRNFVAANSGIFSLSGTAYFAYDIPDLDVFLYSSEGIRFSISSD